jgi:hypothetical protein
MVREFDLGPISPEECVSEAMMFGFSRSVADQIYSEMAPLELNQPHLSVNESTERATWQQCAQNSIESIYFLASRFPDQFDKYVLITGKQGNEDKFKHVPWVDHTYFLVRGKDGTLYAGSPANFATENPLPRYLESGKAVPSGETEYLNPLTKVFKAKSAEELMNQIHEFEGGEWPETSMIEKGITTGYKDPDLEYFVGRNTEDDFSEHDVVMVKANVLEITTSYDENNEPPNNVPIRFRQATTFRDLGSPLDPIELQKQIDHDAIEEDVARELARSESPALDQAYVNDSKWI